MTAWPTNEDEFVDLAESPHAKVVVNEAILGPCLMTHGDALVELQVVGPRVSVVAHRGESREQRANFPKLLLAPVACRLLLMGKSEGITRDEAGEFTLRVPPQELTVRVVVTPDGDDVRVQLSCTRRDLRA